MVKTGQALTVLFPTQSPTTGAATDATGTPTGVLYVNGTADGAGVTVTNITTGLYKAAVTLPALIAGDVVSLKIAATVSGVAGVGVVFQANADTNYQSETHTRIGALGAGLTAVPWNAAWDAEVQSEAADALAATDAIGTASISAAAGAKIADIVLRRTAANIEASANGDTLAVESLYGLVMAAFEAALSGTTLTIRKTDATTLGTKTVTVDAAADPITGIT